MGVESASDALWEIYTLVTSNSDILLYKGAVYAFPQASVYLWEWSFIIWGLGG